MRKAAYGPRQLTCVEVTKKNRTFMDPVTRLYGRCGQCAQCWRLFKWACKAQGKALPLADSHGRFAGFNVARLGHRRG